METRMRYDDVAWAKSDEISDGWADHIFNPKSFQEIGDFLLLHHQASDAFKFSLLDLGGFNITLQMDFARTQPAIIRFPLPGSIMFPEEKTRTEVAAMRFIMDKTSIPVPLIIHQGRRTESPSGLGPFIIMEFVEHHANMIEVLKLPGRPKEERVTLDPNIDENTLQSLYREMSHVLLSLSGLCQSIIGSLSQIDDFTWTVSDRPLSMHMNELVRVGTLPQSKLPTTPFDTASSYFENLAELHISHLIAQRNDAVDSADDCWRKFVARFLFRKLTRDDKLKAQWIAFENGPFPIWCDDFRPGNVLVNADHKITGVVDWEFTYAAPVEFVHAPPWWLLINKPEYWPQGLDDWSREYEKRLQTFLRVMIECENKAIQNKRLDPSHRLSGPMQRSWETGDFWIMYAARNNFAFDSIYWQNIDQRFFGSTAPEGDICDVWKERLHLLEPEKRVFIKKEVDRKLKEMEAGGVLAWDPDEYTLDYMKKLEATNDGMHS